jgi:hypothetical protein
VQGQCKASLHQNCSVGAYFGAKPPRHLLQRLWSYTRIRIAVYLLPSLILCLDVLVNREEYFIKEIRYLAGLMRQNCQDASWRVERLLSKLEEGESLDKRSTAVQLGEARKELHLMMRGIEGIEKLCELEESRNDS